MLFTLRSRPVPCPCVNPWASFTRTSLVDHPGLLSAFASLVITPLVITPLAGPPRGGMERPGAAEPASRKPEHTRHDADAKCEPTRLRAVRRRVDRTLVRPAASKALCTSSLTQSQSTNHLPPQPHPEPRPNHGGSAFAKAVRVPSSPSAKQRLGRRKQSWFDCSGPRRLKMGAGILPSPPRSRRGSTRQ